MARVVVARKPDGSLVAVGPFKSVRSRQRAQAELFASRWESLGVATLISGADLEWFIKDSAKEADR